MNLNANATSKLNDFLKKPKFKAENETIFNGLSNPTLEPELNTLINQAAKDFLTTVGDHPTEARFQSDIKTGLARFNHLYLELDTEDRERVCSYFEELMDCVGLESSEGKLNDWMYDFNPNEKK